MFDHVSIGVGDIARSASSTTRSLKPLGYHAAVSDGESVAGLRREEPCGLWLGATRSR